MSRRLRRTAVFAAFFTILVPSAGARPASTLSTPRFGVAVSDNAAFGVHLNSLWAQLSGRSAPRFVDARLRARRTVKLQRKSAPPAALKLVSRVAHKRKVSPPPPAPPPPPEPAPAPPSPGSGNRHVFCLGTPTYGTSGWLYDGTATGWVRQYPQGLPGRVSFDNSVDLMQSVGCNTIKAELQPADTDTGGGTSVQRAQLYVTDDQLAKYGGQPSLGTERGNTTWYGFTFSTNAGYKPQTGKPDGSWANWNLLFSWHNTPVGGAWGPQANIQLVVATTTPSSGATAVTCGAGYSPSSQPRLSVELNGGNQDDARWFDDDADDTCRRYFGPTFVSGRVYHVEMGITWGDHKTGAAEFWIDGNQVANANGIDNLWYSAAGGANVYALFENYRPYSPNIGATNDVYYGGLVKGSSRADVQVP